MIQRTLFRSLQQASRQPQCLRSASMPFAASQSAIAPVAAHRMVAQRRTYSEAAELKKEEKPAEDKKANAEPATEDPVAKELEAKKKEVLELTDRIKRTTADFRNLQEQTKREVQAAKDFALQRFSKDLLDTIDNFDRALGAVPADALKAPDANKDLVNLHSGLTMTEKIFIQTLAKHGLERVDPSEGGEKEGEGVKFDPNTMEATFQAPQPGKTDGTVFFTQSKGFKLNGRVMRAAKVGVVRNS
ncbi:Hypothetical protein R9X50_00687800 [Acrodontium crateriforme]|uniref:GrpE protein homolog, mitochondrial n=1 Tax=Acrodontium crateriforme TaxID=150365 RepID=A0AAQ3M998_9PEZI|nr:Hypothetical protein R9X50_00687800 [Acrodontium crateriforme]